MRPWYGIIILVLLWTDHRTHRELKKLNGSMFMPAGGNPFTSRKRQEAADKAALERHRMERDTREQTRREGFNAQQQAEADWKGYAEQKPVRLLGSTGAANKNKYDFEGDEEDEQDEQTIDEGLDEVFNASQTLNVMAKNIGDRLVSQNQMLDRLQEKVSFNSQVLVRYQIGLLTRYSRAILWTIM